MTEGAKHTTNRIDGAGTGAVVQAGSIQSVTVNEVAPTATVRPGMLPPAVSLFTGRASELARLDTLHHARTTSAADDSGAVPAAVVVSPIAGTGGVGKTSLAVHWAHRARHQFPDGQLYVNLRGFDSDPSLAAGHVLDVFLGVLGVPVQRIPVDVDAKAGLYRSLLIGRRMLVLLDNAATPEQVRPLLPSEPGCLVLVTSRSRLSGLVARDGAHRLILDLDVLAPDEAHTLLADAIGHGRADREPQALAELARRCAYLPLALRIAAKRVAARPPVTISDLVQNLALEHRRLDLLATDDEATTVRTVLSWSYRALPSPTAQVFRLLGLQPGPSISLDTATALTGTTTDQTLRHLDLLVGMHLITETTGGRYQFHDLLRAYAAERSDDEHDATCDAATRRLFEWYLHTAHTALFALYPQHPEIPIDPRPSDCRLLAFANRDDALEWFTAEHANLMAVVRRAPAVVQHTVGWQLPHAFDCYLGEMLHHTDRIAVHQLGLAAARHLDNRLGQTWAYLCCGETYIGARRYDDAVFCPPPPGSARQVRYDRDLAHSWLVFLARHTRRLGTQDLAWWRLTRTLSPRRLGILAGLAACLLAGPPVGIVAGLLFAPHYRWVAGIATGLGVGLGAGLVAALRKPIRITRH